uniref:Uncharacterized protein n=1 Tax=Steinernema glaseri TaxID=37863 RepID=A0A1I7YJF7_9BILA
MLGEIKSPVIKGTLSMSTGGKFSETSSVSLHGASTDLDPHSKRPHRALILYTPGPSSILGPFCVGETLRTFVRRCRGDAMAILNSIAISVLQLNYNESPELSEGMALLHHQPKFEMKLNNGRRHHCRQTALSDVRSASYYAPTNFCTLLDHGPPTRGYIHGP